MVQVLVSRPSGKRSKLFLLLMKCRTNILASGTEVILESIPEETSK